MDNVAGTKACPYCAAKIHDKAAICSYCGRDLMDTVPMRAALPPKAQEQVKKINSIISYVVISLFIVFSIACLIVFFTLLSNSY